VRRGAIAKSVCIECEVGGLETHIAQILLEHVHPVFALAAAGHLVTPVVEVEAPTQLAS